MELGECLEGQVLPDEQQRETPRSIRGAPPVRLRNACVARSLDLSGMRVLDVGCAHGRYSLYLADSAKEVVGIDRAPDRIAVAEQTRQALGYSNVQFRLADIYDPGLFDEIGTFDLVVAWGFLHRIPDVFSVVHRLAEVASAFSFEWMTPVFPFMGRSSVAFHRKRTLPEHAAGPRGAGKSLFWCPTPYAVTTIVRECGFEHTKVLGYNDALWPEWNLVLWHLARKLVRPSTATYARVHMIAERTLGSIQFKHRDLREARLPAWDTVGRDYLRRRSRDRLRFSRSL